MDEQDMLDLAIQVLREIYGIAQGDGHKTHHANAIEKVELIYGLLHGDIQSIIDIPTDDESLIAKVQKQLEVLTADDYHKSAQWYTSGVPVKNLCVLIGRSDGVVSEQFFRDGQTEKLVWIRCVTLDKYNGIHISPEYTTTLTALDETEESLFVGKISRFCAERKRER